MLVAKILIAITFIVLTTFFFVFLTTYYLLFRTKFTDIGSLKNTTKLDELKQSTFTEDNQTIVRITVFYECLCPDSRSFFVNQLLPTLEKMPNNITAELIPYGKAKMEVMKNDTYIFQCQHGLMECLGNEIHACIINTVKDKVKRIKLITCMFNDIYNFIIIGKICSEENNVDWSTIKHCIENGEGNKLLKKFGEITEAVIPEMNFVPTVLLNRQLHNQYDVLYNLENAVIAMLTS